MKAGKSGHSALAKLPTYREYAHGRAVIATKTGLENLQNLCRELSREHTAGNLPI